jgi:transposase
MTRKKRVAKSAGFDSSQGMIRGGFLTIEDRKDLLDLAKDGMVAHRLARRANALLLLDKGWSCTKVSNALFMDDDTVRSWYESFRKDGLDGLIGFGSGGSAGFLSSAQAEQVKAYVIEHLPRSTRQIGAFIVARFGVFYESRSGLIKLLNRLGLEYRKPEVIGRHLDEDKQKAFITAYESLLNRLGPDEAVLFADAVHPTHAVRPVGCWVVRGQKPVIEQTTGRQRLNIHGAIDLETGQTRMIEAESIDAASTIRLLESIERLYSTHAAIHLFVDNARYHHAVLVQEWLARPGCRIKLHFVPTYCPHLNPIERLWGLMHKHVTHNKGYRTFNEFVDKILAFLRQKVPKNWDRYRDTVTDNFRIIRPRDFRVIA